MLLSLIQAGQTRENQVSKLLDLMNSRSDQHFKSFVNALVTCDQDEFAVMLDKDVALRRIHARNLSREEPVIGQGTVVL